MEKRKIWSYRFGFNGQELDNEISGTGNSYTAQFWQYNPRLGRRWNVDPVDKPWMSSYHAFSNKPIINIDANGANDDHWTIDSETGQVSYEPDDGGDIVQTIEIKYPDGTENYYQTGGHGINVKKGYSGYFAEENNFDPMYSSTYMVNAKELNLKVQIIQYADFENNGYGSMEVFFPKTDQTGLWNNSVKTNGPTVGISLLPEIFSGSIGKVEYKTDIYGTNLSEILNQTQLINTKEVGAFYKYTKVTAYPSGTNIGKEPVWVSNAHGAAVFFAGGGVGTNLLPSVWKPRIMTTNDSFIRATSDTTLTNPTSQEFLKSYNARKK